MAYYGRFLEPSLEIEPAKMDGHTININNKQMFRGVDYSAPMSVAKHYETGWIMIRISGYTGWTGQGATGTYPSQLLLVRIDEKSIVREGYICQCGKLWRKAWVLLEQKIN